MFDGVPEFYARRRQGPRLSLGAAAILLLTAAVALAGFGRAAAFREAAVISSPSHMRQIEVFAGPAATVFYLHNAGYRLPHRLQLIGIVDGARGFSVQWRGPDAVRILLRPGWSRLVAGHPKGVTVAFTTSP